MRRTFCITWTFFQQHKKNIRTTFEAIFFNIIALLNTSMLDYCCFFLNIECMKEMDQIQINQKRSSFKKRIRKELERNEYYGNQKPKVPTEFKFNFP